MALHITYSNSYEVLKAALCVNLEFDRNQSSLFNPIEIIVPGREVKHDISRTLCEKSSVCIGFSFTNLAAWLHPYGAFWHTASLDNFKLPWHIYPILIDIKNKNQSSLACPIDNYKRLIDYLDGKTCGEIFFLAERIARVFTKYVNYRYDWVCSWMQDDSSTADEEALNQQSDCLWQKCLWKELYNQDKEEDRRSESTTPRSFTGKILSLTNQLLSEKSESQNRLNRPETTHIFLPHSLPPLSLPVLAKEAQKRDIQLYIFNPCCQYWFDSNDAVPLWLFQSNETQHGWEETPTKNLFLRENAGAIRAFIDRLWRYAPDEGFTQDKLIEDSYSRPKEQEIISLKMTRQWEIASQKAFSQVNSTDQSMIWQKRLHKDGEKLSLLDAIVNSFLFDCPLQGNGIDFHFDADALDAAHDKSLRFFKASNLSGEIEGVIDWIESLAETQGYRSSDFLVVTPDVTKIAGLIRGTLEARPKEKRIDYRILGEIRNTENSILEAGKFFFVQSDFESFFKILSAPLFMRCWELEYSDLSLLRNWLAAAGFRAGIVSRQSPLSDQTTEADQESDTTLDRALERLAVGFAYPDKEMAVFGRALAVFGTEISGYESVSKHPDLFKKLLAIWSAFQTLADLVPKVSEEGFLLKASEWKNFSFTLLEQLYPDASAYFVQEAKENFADAVDQLHETIASTDRLRKQPIESDVYWTSLERMIGISVAQSRSDGAVTFANMDALRNIPFKAVAMIGLGEASNFPGENIEEEFDLTCAYRYRNNAPAPRRGDQDSRISNRSIFLELLCSAQKNVLITYDAGEHALDKPLNASSVVEDFCQWLETESPGIVKKISGILPPSRLSPESFGPSLGSNKAPDGIRFFSNRDEKEFEAVHHAAQTPQRERHPEDFLRGFSKLDNTAEQSTPTLFYQTLVDAWLDPTRYIHKQLGLSTQVVQEEPSAVRISGPDFQNDPLQRLNQLKRIRRLLDAAYPRFGPVVDKEKIVDEICSSNYFKLNPMLGCQVLRYSAIKSLVEDAFDFKLAEETVAPSGTEPFNPGSIDVKHIRLKLPTIELVRHPQDANFRDFVRCAYSKRDRMRAALLQIALRAADFEASKPSNYRLRLIAQEKNEAPAEYVFGRGEGSDMEPYADLSQIPPESAFHLLESLVSFVCMLNEKIRVSPKGVAPNYSSAHSEFDPIWRGFESLEQQLSDKKYKLENSFVLCPSKATESKKTLLVQSVQEITGQIRTLTNTVQQEMQKEKA